MTTRRKFVVTVLILLATLALLVIVLVPRLADVDRYRPWVVARLEQATRRKVEIGRLRLTILPSLAVRADEVTVGNPPGFPAAPFLEIQRVYAQLDPGALLHREILIRSLKLESPTLHLASDAQGRWNTSNPQAPRAELRPAAWQTATATSMLITDVELEDGRVTVTAGAGGSQPGPPPFLEADGIAAQLEDVNAEALGVHLMGADAGWGATEAGSPGDSKRPGIVETAWIQSAPTASGIEGAAPPGAVRPQGALAAHGTLSAKSARFGAIQTANLRSRLELYSGGALLDGLALQLFGGQMTGNFAWESGLQPPRYTTHLSFAAIDVARVLQAFPSARGKLTGTLDGYIDLTGWSSPDGAGVPSRNPLDNKEGKGQVTVRQGTLPGIRLNPDLMALIRNIIRTGPIDPSAFRSMSADLEIAQGEIRSRQVSIAGNGIDLQASGALALGGEGRLDYQGVARISARQNAVGNLLAGLLGSKMASGGQISFPFVLSGTLTAPHFEVPRSVLFH